MDFQQLVIIGVLVESIGESVWWLVSKEWSKERIVALVLGLLFSGLTGADLFAYIGLPLAGYVPETVGLVVGVVCSGLMGMRGATVVHDLLGLVRGNLEKLKG